ncbi:glycosyltransferase family 2 protein [Castellaniella sp.]|uniref:glycosyltransferase family 2 protein n=1 Tax=Castellaniella sp. TaxID=1955812 RepID=UPI002AFEA1FA|nr:glycosyltransferase family 2 protein [Castellaniella sp.]
MACWRHLFTVLTPTYNRGHTLERVYHSLREQSFQDFEWVVVDDGSTDHTRDLIQAWQAEASFPIRYVWQTNQHKKTAFNNGVRQARGEWLVAIDSDDELDPNALYQMASVWDQISPAQRHRYVAITGLCARPDGQIVGDMYPQDVMDITSLDMTFRHHVRGEKFGCLRTDVLRQFPFPEDIPGFVPESLVWRAIARAGYLTRFVNQVFRVYHDSADSLSRQGRSSDGARHALGLWLLAYDTVECCLPWLRYQPMTFLAAAARYTRFSLHLRRRHVTRPTGRRLTHLLSRCLVACMWPIGAGLFVRDCFSIGAAGRTML